MKLSTNEDVGFISLQVLWLLACSVLITIILTDKIPEIQNKVRGDITQRKSEVTKLRGDVKRLKNKSFAVQCAWQDSWSADDSVITYDRLTFDEVSGGDGGLDINTGDFTVGKRLSGVWAVTYSIKSLQNSGEYNQVWLTINGEQRVESGQRTYYGGPAGSVGSLGSRSLYLRLEAGDTVSLRTGTVHYLGETTLCFQLVRGDD